MSKVIILIIAVPVIIVLTIIFSLVLGSLIRFINEGSNFKSPLDSSKSIESLFKDKEFYKTLVTGFFPFFTLIVIINFIRE